MNQLEKTVHKLKRYPTWVLSYAIGKIVKFTGTAGVSYDLMTKDKVVVSLKNKTKVRNHIGQVHAVAMLLLAETATGMVTGMNVPDDKIVLLKYLNAKFVRRSAGAITAEAWLDESQQAFIRTTEKGDLLVSVKITDESGEEPVVCEACWAWIPKARLKQG
ncbi:MAG: DUF4442 domain-containing protein [Bacteroidetes bacterium]|nr:MAG: DUF4442 domain-containing protein [Bacteroidota bacterium]PTM12526.1 MAG: DUF4442 domain-containing protein [Bacteroidota bacterium]